MGTKKTKNKKLPTAKAKNNDSSVKKELPAYLKVNDSLYEQIDDDSVEMVLEFSEEDMALIKRRAKEGGFISIQEYIRHVIRCMMPECQKITKEHGFNNKKSKKPKK